MKAVLMQSGLSLSHEKMGDASVFRQTEASYMDHGSWIMVLASLRASYMVHRVNKTINSEPN
ncbi:hypothetical protein [Coleofasciculus sp. G2-EDA-02]|uniref:hypothetical protein n=1 Tax=Coleofasciculus sp. G2-EDA-02 TaxID=3069529 RepID=UPI003304A8D9